MNKIRYLLTALAMMTMSSPVYALTTNATDTGIEALVNIKFTPSSKVGSFSSTTGLYTPGDPLYEFSGTAVIGTASTDYWNNINPLAVYDPASDPVKISTELLYAQFGTSSVPPTKLTFTAEAIGSALKGSSGFYGTSYSTLMNSYVHSSSAESMTISGLEKSKNYDVYVLTQGPKSFNGSQLTLTGLNSSGSPASFTQSGTSHATNSTFINGTNYMLATLQTDTNGNLHFAYGSNNSKDVLINGLQIAASPQNDPPPTPEPASMLLLGVGGALISAAKLRKKKSADNPVA